MTASPPPRIATWLLERLARGPRRESLIGDLIEEHQRGRSSWWYSRQTVTTLATHVAAAIWQHKWLAIWVIALGTYLPDVYLSITWRWVVRLDRLWYPHLIFSRWSWMVINPWAYRLQLYRLTGNISWCQFLVVASWMLTRLHPRQRVLVVTLFLISQVGLSLPYLQFALIRWVREPGNPLLFFSLLWFSIWSLVVTPACILLGSRWGTRASDTDGAQVVDG